MKGSAEMKILNFGSLNYDYVYTVDHIVREGETTASLSMEVFCGGKGLNQSLALARAGAPVCHAGMVGEDGGRLLEICRSSGVDVSLVRTVPGKSGHTIIQVDRSGQNCILLYGGSNRRISLDYAESALSGFSEGDVLLLQNEINDIPIILDLAYRKKMRIVLNPSPFDKNILACDLSRVSMFFLNEVEGSELTGEREPDRILDRMQARFPGAVCVLTLGRDGAVCLDRGDRFHQPIFPSPRVDTTGAGDTFTGFFLSEILRQGGLRDAMKLASQASAIAVSRKGAAASIPTLAEVQSRFP